MSSFHERQKSLFNTLKEAEDQYSFCKTNKATETKDYEMIDKQRYRKLKREMKQFRGKESIYKRAEASIRECLRVKDTPDYIKNPQKWSYYSLSDVTPEQMSDSRNAATALAFIREMEDRNEAYSNVIDETGAVFKKPIFQISKTLKPKPEEEKKILFKSTKVIMPEYVVGAKKSVGTPKPFKATVKKGPKQVELKLNHLYDDDYDSNNDEIV